MSDPRPPGGEHWCSVCEDETGGGSHYHCGRCLDPKPTSMMGHYLRFLDGSWGFGCDEVNLGKFISAKRVVNEHDIRPAQSGERVAP